MTTRDYVYNTTSWISFNLAPSSRYCVMSGLEGYSWTLLKRSQFSSFGEVFEAWLQNLLGNVITFNSLYKKIEEAEEAGNTREVYYWYGRFTILFIDFEPIEDDEADFDTNFDDDVFLAQYAVAAPASLAAIGEYETRQLRSSKVNNVRLEDHPRVAGSVGNIYAFANGFINASFGDASPNSKICQTNITRIIDYSQQFSSNVKNASEEALEDAAVAAENVLASVHPITFSCYESLYEYGDTADYYMETTEDFSIVSYNLIHKLGKIYDTLYFT